MRHAKLVFLFVVVGYLLFVVDFDEGAFFLLVVLGIDAPTTPRRRLCR